jgi:hypothetical protein
MRGRSFRVIKGKLRSPLEGRSRDMISKGVFVRGEILFFVITRTLCPCSDKLCANSQEYVATPPVWGGKSKAVIKILFLRDEFSMNEHRDLGPW